MRPAGSSSTRTTENRRAVGRWGWGRRDKREGSGGDGRVLRGPRSRGRYPRRTVCREHRRFYFGIRGRMPIGTGPDGRGCAAVTFDCAPRPRAMRPRWCCRARVEGQTSGVLKVSQAKPGLLLWRLRLGTTIEGAFGVKPPSPYGRSGFDTKSTHD